MQYDQLPQGPAGATLYHAGLSYWTVSWNEPCSLGCFRWVFCHCSDESLWCAALFRSSPDSCYPHLQSSHDAVYPIEFGELNMPCTSQYVEVKSKKDFASMLEVYSGNLRTSWKGNNLIGDNQWDHFVSSWAKKKGALCYFGRTLVVVGVRTYAHHTTPDSQPKVLNMHVKGQ